jgi:hypothetical protein
MRKVFFVVAIMVFTAQIFAQTAKKIEFENGVTAASKFDFKWPANKPCPEWLDPKTGQIKYFEYTSDFVIDAPEICKPLGLESFTIQKGRYPVLRTSENSGGLITLTVAKSVPIAYKPQKIANSVSVEGTNPKGQDCKGLGNSCWYASANSRENTMPITITPVFENGVCKTIKVQCTKGTDPRNPGF